MPIPPFVFESSDADSINPLATAYGAPATATTGAFSIGGGAGGINNMMPLIIGLSVAALVIILLKKSKE